VEGEKTGVFSQGEQRSVEGGSAPSKKVRGSIPLGSIYYSMLWIVVNFE